MSHLRPPDIMLPEKILQAKMNEHLSNTRIDIRTALQRFERYGVKFDRRFQRDFIKHTTDCVIDTCEQYCTKIRHRSTRKDGKSTSETARKSDENGKKRHSKERRTADRQTTSKADEIIEPKKRSQEVNESDQLVSLSPESKRLKTDDKHEAIDAVDHSNDVVEMIANEDPKPLPSSIIATAPRPIDQPLFFYYCAHCLESGESIGGTIQDVYSHWQSSHIINLPSKPFEFSVAQIAVCHFGDAVGTYRELLKHQQQTHADEQLAILNYDDRTKCGICLKPAPESIVDHFELEHKTISQADIFNPMRLSEQQLDELLAIEIHKKRQCGHCQAIFETENEIDIHHSIGHENEEKISRPYNDNRNPFLICGYCQHKIDRDSYFSHVKSHPYVFKCWKCTYNSNDLVNLIEHDKQLHERDTLNYHCAMFADWLRSHFYKTRIVFPNGLVLKAHNLLGTKFDESRVFEMFLDGLVDLVKGKYALLNQQDATSTERMVSSSKDGVMNTPKDDAAAAAIDTVDCGGSTPTEDPAFLMQELQKQNELANNLLIMNMPRMSNMEPAEMFLKLCSQLDVTVKTDDIVNAYRQNDNLVVTLKDYNCKEDIRYAATKKTIKSDMIFSLHADQWNKTIKVLSHTTRYYSEMLTMAREAKKNRIISFYELTKQGISVARSAISDERIFISKTEFAHFIARCQREKH